ncbi:GNAT family N-acetyltransferase [uncultured Fusobacterium sp.]|uniref:GNAT family N-acetyltransferase n=1 Tax=uncultured Fusobacterium sp. TaxID=159267 RepID=UPI0027DE87D9|nr:GNAT family N-acetyltransferase [uncultured Fusobacterium sp.]
MRYEHTDENDINFLLLCDELIFFFNQIIGDKEKDIDQKRFTKTDSIQDVIISYDDDLLAGCVVFRKYDDESAEMKRLYVKKIYRKKGIAYKLIEMIEKSAKDKGYKCMVLETGESLKKAISLYQKMGYTIIDNLGTYGGMGSSLLMKKKL